MRPHNTLFSRTGYKRKSSLTKLEERYSSNIERLRMVVRDILREAISLQDYEDTLATARLVHLGQKRRSGEAYFDHPVAVENIVKNYYPSDLSSQLLALLHDTVEDRHKQNNLSQEELFSMIRAGIHDREKRNEIMISLKLLTHDKSIPYNEYLLTVAQNTLALRVKISDMIHNSSSSPSVNQIEKYRRGFSALESFFGGTPPNISISHWNELKKVLGE